MTTKEHIENIVRSYISDYPTEWSAFKLSMKEKQDSSSKFGVMSGSDIIERKVAEIPETLYTSLKLKLSQDDWEWFQTKDAIRWFATTFKQFRSSERV